MELQESDRSTKTKDGTLTTIFDIIFHGRSTYDAWLNGIAYQVAQVLLVFPYSFSQTGLASGILFQLLYATLGCWSCFLITLLYVEYRHMKEDQGFTFDNHVIQWYEILDGLLGPFWKMLGLIFNNLLLFSASTIQIIACGSIVYDINKDLTKRTWTIIFGACLFIAILPKDVRSYRVWSFVNVIMIAYVSWYMTISSAIHGQSPDVEHTAPHGVHSYYTGASNIMYAFGGHALTVELMHAMKEPRKYRTVYIYVVLFILCCTLPSAITVYWIYGDCLSHYKDALQILPNSHFRNAAVILALMHEFNSFGINALPVFLTWEKLCRMHKRHYVLRILVRVPVFLVMWFTAIMIPFFGPISAVVGSVFTSSAVHLIPCAATMAFYRTQKSRKNAVEKLPRFLSWTWMYCINIGILIWVTIHSALGLNSSIYNLKNLVHTFGFFQKCYNCELGDVPSNCQRSS